MKLKLICCEVLMRPVCLALANSPHTIDPEFTNLGAHELPDWLRGELQKRIDSVPEDKGYDAILLGYGLCGNSTQGLCARNIPLVIPRAHDCCTIFMGSKKAFIENFGENLSSRWSSVGYMERDCGYLRNTETGVLLGLNNDYQQLVEKYGEDNASFIWETLHPKDEQKELIYIRLPELSHLGYLDKFKSFAAEQGSNVRVLDGDSRLLKALLNGDWNEDEFLVVPPGKCIAPIYDHETIIKAE